MDHEQPSQTQVVFTNKAACRDCYRCLRVCPVKAIRLRDGQAYVVEERCISCGTCIRECPQQAKTYRHDLEQAMRLFGAGGVVAVSVAPSFAALYGEWERRRFPSALRRLGFGYVGETAVGAYYVGRETADYVARTPGRVHIASACPAVVNYIEQYAPDLSGRLVPVVSPMIAHARLIRQKLGPNAKVVFIGPCVAKKQEAERPEYAGLIDCVLTFAELQEWFEKEGVVLAQCEESGFDDTPGGHSRYFPVPGGLMRTAGMDEDMLSTATLAISGMEQMREAFTAIDSDPDLVLIEPLFCTEGCATGPGVPCDTSIYSRRNQVLQYAREHVGPEADAPGAPPETAAIPLAAKYAPREAAGPRFTEEEIRRAMAEAGKAREEDQLNCGACGYPTCRDKIIANLSGMAELEMCVPRMRRLAEQRTDRIISTSPNGILILDDRLTILGMNPAFKQMFMCSDAVLGKPVSYLMDPGPFERLAAGEQEMFDVIVRHENYNLTCHEKLYPLREEKQYVGIFVNITKSQQDEVQLRRLRSETVEQARELLQHQIQAAQEMAKHLGETTARGEALVRHLLRMVAEEPDAPDEGLGIQPRRKDPWGTRTSK